jgi:hypothetical protein
MPDEATLATLIQVKDYFGGYATLADFSKDWKQVPDADRLQLRAGIGDGSLTY